MIRIESRVIAQKSDSDQRRSIWGCIRVFARLPKCFLMTMHVKEVGLYTSPPHRKLNAWTPPSVHVSASIRKGQKGSMTKSSRLRSTSRTFLIIFVRGATTSLKLSPSSHGPSKTDNEVCFREQNYTGVCLLSTGSVALDSHRERFSLTLWH